jgi:hypothetical protein
MWTLVIVVLAFSGGLTGATSSTAFLDFTNKERCEAAAAAIGVPNIQRSSPGSAGEAVEV